ncbi:MAG: hypothetical protein J1E63_06605 [Muribaculaceae bacterium]|nr:hypothetical protein [Muribaculaceae bacterium]
MKKIITSIAAALCLLSANAITVTHDGKTVENGATITVGADGFEVIEKVPGVLYSVKAEEIFNVTGATNLSLTATSATQDITICALSGECYTLMGEDGNYSLTMPSFNDGMTVDLEYNRTTEVPKEIHSVDITITSSDAPFKMTVVFDTVNNAGVGNIASDTAGSYTVYNLNGVKVLETTDKAAVNNLPAGVYVVNGTKVIK